MDAISKFVISAVFFSGLTYSIYWLIEVRRAALRLHEMADDLQVIRGEVKAIRRAVRHEGDYAP